MERPKAIVWFERCYLGAFAIKLALTIVNWDKADSAATQIGTTIALLLWFGVVYRHSNISRWIIIIFALIGAIWTCISVASGAYGWGTIVLMVVALMLNLGAALLLIGAKVEPWFEKPATDDPT
ncbi:MAG: hypothetical protein WC729_07675 [Sphingomonas sp.]|uniref:hypothetical protein n=1 Tax=Sphingomonas sp. TaxID=28214 RepID=UPI003563DD01